MGIIFYQKMQNEMLIPAGHLKFENMLRNLKKKFLRIEFFNALFEVRLINHWNIRSFLRTFFKIYVQRIS